MKNKIGNNTKKNSRKDDKNPKDNGKTGESASDDVIDTPIDFTDHRATKEDLDLIIEGIEYVKSGKVDRIFEDKSVFDNLNIITYDSKYIYLYRYKTSTKFEKIRHYEEDLDWELMHKGWRVSLERIHPFLKYGNLTNYHNFQLNGGLFSFTRLIHSQWNSIYAHKDSYVPVIIHEFAHAYFNNLNPRLVIDAKLQEKLINCSLSLLDNKISEQIPHISLSHENVTEIFAFCTELWFSHKYFPSYAKSLKKFIHWRISSINNQDTINPWFQNLALSEAHMFSYVMGTIIMHKYPDTWDKVLLNAKITL